MLVGQHDLRVELRVLHRDPGLVGERHQEVEILRVEGIAGELRSDDDGADDPILGDERQHERPVEARQRVVQPLPLVGQPFTRDLVGEQQILRAHERRDDLARRVVRRLEAALREAFLRDRLAKRSAGLGEISVEIDGGAFGVRRGRHGVVHELQQDLEIEDTRQRATRLPQRALVVHVRAIDVSIQQPPRRIARQRNQQTDRDDRGDQRDELLGIQVIREPGPRHRQQRHDRHERHGQRESQREPAMDHEANVHQPMADDGVRDHGDEDQREVRADPAVGSVPGDQRKKKICTNTARATNNKAEGQVVDLHTRQPSRLPPFGAQHGKGRQPREDEVDTKEEIEGAGFPSRPLRAQARTADD